MDFDNFDIADAAIIGGIMGFAEESIRRESEGVNTDELPDIEVKPEDIRDVNLRLVYNENPDLFNHIVNTIRKQNKKWRTSMMLARETSAELRALEETEPLMGEENEYRR